MVRRGQRDSIDEVSTLRNGTRRLTAVGSVRSVHSTSENYCIAIVWRISDLDAWNFIFVNNYTSLDCVQEVPSM